MFLLEHQYSKHGLSIVALARKDRAHADVIRAAIETLSEGNETERECESQESESESRK